jgi:hypothetical protein
LTEPNGNDLQLSTLTIGRKLGTGGQGVVYELEGQQRGLVYKEYMSPKVNDAALARLVGLPAGLTDSERKRLLGQSAWPRARVLDGNRVKGFIMQKVPAEFWGQATAGPRLRELQYLLYPPKPMWGDIVPLDPVGRLDVVRQTSAFFFLLHSKNLVVGDISMSNLLWSPSPIGIFLLDCDGVRALGASPVLPQPETPDWGDPRQPVSGPDLDTDRYKLALLVARVLTRNSSLRPGDSASLEFLPGLPERVVAAVSARFGEAAGPRGTRPDAGQWMRALDDRGEIELPPLPPVRTAPGLPRAPMEGKRAERPEIRLKKPTE